MAIDKIIPRKLVKDKDERLVQEGDMTHALNVTISESGEGTEGVLKNLYGTSAAAGYIAPDGDYTVIGRCVDQPGGFVYFFVCDNVGDDHQIIRLNVSENSFLTVMSHQDLNFDSGHPVKADILSSDFSKEGVVQSILYFTDNYNPPRRINVDRSINNEYSQLSSLNFQKVISVVKAPPTDPITFVFETDDLFFANNLKSKHFQFASQVVYEDGEESAISTYSKIAVSDAAVYDGLNTVDSAQVPNTDNRLRLRINYSPFPDDEKHLPKVKMFRILAREGNDGPFVKIDEFDPSQNISQKIHGNTVQVYNKNSGEYLFYNAKNYGAIDSNTVNKTYDNVPLKAEGQAIVGNRLFYSNYEEGRARHNVSGATITVRYADDAGFNTVFDPTASIVTESSGVITVNLLAGTSFDSFADTTADQNTIVPPGTSVSLFFTYDPVGDVRKDDAVLATAQFNTFKSTLRDGDGAFFNWIENLIGDSSQDNWWQSEIKTAKVHFGKGDEAADVDAQFIPIGASTSGSIKVYASYTSSREMTVQQIGQKLSENIESIKGSKTWLSKGSGAPAFKGVVDSTYTGIYSAGEVIDFVSNDVVVYKETDLEGTTTNISSLNTGDCHSTATFSHDDITQDPTVGYAQFTIKPRIVDLDMSELFSKTDIPQKSGGVVYGQVSTLTRNTNPSTSGNYGATNSYLTYDWSTGDYGFNFSYVAGSAGGSSSTFKQSFKAGSSYDIGLVFYDEYGRSSFVQELGTAYVKSLFERGSSTGKGSASIEVDLSSVSADPPSWAKKYQIVVADNNTYETFDQYTTGAAYVPVEQPGVNNSPGKTDDRKIWVSLKTLDIYNERSDNPREYSHSVGDKLRVLQYDGGNVTETITYPKAVYSPSGTDAEIDRPIEFDVVGVETYEVAQDNPCCDLNPGADHEDQFVGTFLILAAPAIDSGVGGQIKYPGFDWYSVIRYLHSPVVYPDSSQGSLTSYWGRKTVVELLTPTTGVSNKFYYEVGNSTEIRSYKNPNFNKYGPPVILDGDVWVRPVSCLTGLYDTQTGDWDSPYHPEEWSYVVRNLECQGPSESFNKKVWNKGRAHLPYRGESVRKIRNGITYSDAYVEDGDVLQLSSFNASLGNFTDMDGKYGAIRYLDNYDDSILAIQESRVAFIPVNKNIIEYSDGGGGLAISTNVVGQASYYSGDYGCASNPESVTIFDGKVSFVDDSRSKVLLHSNGQLVPVSDIEMSSFFFDEMAKAKAAGGVKAVTGFDPRTEVLYVTIKPVGSYPGVTAAFNTRLRVWESIASFKPDFYASLNDSFVSAKYLTETIAGFDNVSTILHDHSSVQKRNRFYGVDYDSEVKVISKINPSLVKMYDSLSYEGTNTWASDSISTDLGQSSNAYNFVEKEGARYSSIGRDTSSASSAQIRSAGLVNGTPADASNTVTVSNIDLDRSSILGLELYVLSGESLVRASDEGESAVITSASGNQITIEGTIDETIVVDDAKLFAQGNKAVDGDKLRGRYATISMSNSSTAPVELYCINAHVTESKLDHSLGQE